MSAHKTIALICLMLMAVLGCMFYVSSQQILLSGVREDARKTRLLRQAVLVADRSVLVAVAAADDGPMTANYAVAANSLDTLGTVNLPETVLLNGNYFLSKTILARLKAGWEDTIAYVQAGNFNEARELYKKRQVNPTVQAFIAAISQRIETIDSDFSVIEWRIKFATMATFLAQIATGLLSIAAFYFSHQRGTRAANAREAIMASANTTRERVLRLFQMTDMLQSAADHGDANAVLLSTAADLLPSFGGALYTFNNSGDRLTLSTQWGLADDIKLTDSFAPQSCWALKRGKPHINLPGSHKLRCEHYGLEYGVLELPMIARGDILGLLHIYCDRPEAEKELSEIMSVATALADAMSLALSNLALREKLRSQALRDPLTGLYNRRYMEDTLERVVRLSERERSEVSVVMIDLDHFKRLNDQHGHAKGDSVLRDVAAIITNQLRDSDVACRYGGEELTVILPQCGLDQAARKAEKLRSSIASLSDPKGAQITASFGVASIPETSVSARDLMAAADAALYEAKQQGRNRVACAEPTAETTVGNVENAFRIELQAAE